MAIISNVMSPELTLIFMEWQYWKTNADWLISFKADDHVIQDSLSRMEYFKSEFSIQLKKEQERLAKWTHDKDVSTLEKVYPQFVF